MLLLVSQNKEGTQAEAPRNESAESSSVLFEANGRNRKRKLGTENSQDIACIDQNKKCGIDDLTVMEGSSSSAHSPTPSNGIIRPISNQIKPGIAMNNHFHQSGKSSNSPSYGAKSSQTKKLVIKNFKGEYVGE